MNKRKILTGLFLLLFTGTLVFGIVPKASAFVMSGTFENASIWRLESLVFDSSDIGVSLERDDVEAIGGGDVTRGLQIINSYVASQVVGPFFDRDTSDTGGDQRNWQYNSPNNTCQNSEMQFDEADQHYELREVNIEIPGQIGCIDILDGDQDLVLGADDIDGAVNTHWAYSAENTIVPVDGRGGEWVLIDEVNYPNQFFGPNDDWLQRVNSTTVRWYFNGIDFVEQNVIPYDPNNPWIPGTPGVPGAGGPGNNPPVPTTCANAEGVGGFALRWIMCPVIELLDTAVNWLDTQLQAILVVRDPTQDDDDPNSLAIDGGIGNDTSDDQLHNAWGRIRNLALVILIPIMLVMVIGTALGINAIDAYTVRRAMPRFLVAVLFISVSWYITGFMITFTNIIGTGLRGLITQPFGGSASLSELISISGAGTTTYVGLVIFGGLILSGTGFMIIMSYALVALIGLLIGYFVLTLRQLLLIALVLLAPLAILSWIFPGRDRLWKLWWGTFTRLLLMFPFIMLLIGAGEVFARIISIAL